MMWKWVPGKNKNLPDASGDIQNIALIQKLFYQAQISKHLHSFFKHRVGELRMQTKKQQFIPST